MSSNYTPSTAPPVERHHHEPWVINAFITVDAIHIVLTLLGNLVVLLCIWRTSHLRVPAYLYVTSVALSHMLVGLFVIPMFIVNHFPEDAMSTGVCVTLQFLGNMASTASPFSAIALARHQFRQFTSQLQQSGQTATFRRAGLDLVVVWLLASLYAIKDAVVHDMVEEDHVMGDETVRVYMCEVPEKYQLVSNIFVLLNFVFLYLTPFFFMLVLYALLIRNLTLSPRGGAEFTKQERIQRRNLLITIIVVLSAFVVCFLGNYVWGIYVYWGPGFFEGSILVKSVLQLVAFAQGWLNVLLIVTLNEAFRKAVNARLTIRQTDRTKDGVNEPNKSTGNNKVADSTSEVQSKPEVADKTNASESEAGV